MTCYSIAKQLNALGIPTRYAKDGRGIRGKATARLWRPGRVYNMLRNRTYKGEWIYGKRTKKRSPSLIQGKCPPIVDAAVFDKAINRLKENNRWADRNSKRFYLLRGFVKCDECGHTYCGYAANTSRKRELRYYRCNRNGSKGNLLSDKCDSPSVSAKVLEELVWQQTAKFIENPDTVKRILLARKQSRKENHYKVHISEAENRLVELLEAEKRLLGIYSDPRNKFTKEALDSQVDKVIQSRELVNKHIKELAEAQAGEKELKAKLENVDFILSNLRDSIKEATPEIKRQVIENILLEVNVGKGDDGNPILKITYVFEENNSIPSCYNPTNNEHKSHQLQSARMPVRLLRRPPASVQLPSRAGGPLPAAHQWAVYRQGGHIRRSAPYQLREADR